MERFYFYEELKDKISNERPDFVVDSIDLKHGVAFDVALCKNAIINQSVSAAKILRVEQVTDIDDTPDNIIASFKYDQEIITRQKYIHTDSYVVYYESSKYYVNLTGEKASSYLISEAKKAAESRKYYGISNSIFPKLPIWSTSIKERYEQKYGENAEDKLLMLFFDSAGSERFRGRYYSVVAELIKENFLEKVKEASRADGADFYAFTSAENGIMNQIIPSINTIGFSGLFDKVFLNCPKGIIKSGFIKRYLKYFLDVNRKKTVAKISYEDFCVLPLLELKSFIDRLLASGVKHICIESGRQNDILLKKRDILTNYINTLGVALNMGKRKTDCLLVFPSSSAMGEFSIDDDEPIMQYSAIIDEEIDMLNRAHVLYDVANENQLGNDVKISGSLVSAGGNTYTGLILLSAYTILPKTAGFILKFAENGGRIYTLGDLPEKIDGFKSQKIADINNVIKPISKGEFSALRRSGNPVFSEMQVDMYACELDSGKMLYMASNISGGKASFSTFDDILRLDTVSFTEKSCTFSNKIGKVMGKQVIELDKNYTGSVIFIVGKAKKSENLSDYIENLEISPYFDVVKTDANTFTLNKCDVKSGYHRLKNTTVYTALKKLAEMKSVQNVQFTFSFSISKIDEKTYIALYFKNQYKFDIKINGKPLSLSDGEQPDITDYIAVGQNEISLSCDNFGECLKKDKDFLSNLLLRGNFAVMNKTTSSAVDDAVITKNDFTLNIMPEIISIERVLESGFWFFSGSMELSQKFNLQKQFDMKYVFGFKKFYGLNADVFINGQSAGSLYLPPYSLDITRFVNDGENAIKIVLYANQYNVRALTSEINEDVYFEPFCAKILTKSNESALIECSDITKNYAESTVLDSVEFNIKEGEFAVIYGEKDAGKTTLINILGGMEKADSGSVSVDDVRIDKMGDTALSAYRLKEVAFIFPKDNLIEGYSIADNIELACEKKTGVLDISPVLRSVGLGGRLGEKVSSLTDFEKQKVAVARALAKNPRIILCDEPTFNMPPSQAKEILHLLYETCKLTGKTVIVATCLDAICDMADRVIRLKNGKVADESVNPMPTPLERIEL